MGADTDTKSTDGPNTELPSENSERENLLNLQSPSLTTLSIWITTVPALLSPPLTRESRSSEELPLLMENISEMDTAPKLQLDAKIPTDTKSVPQEKVRSIPPISSSSTESTPGETATASKLEDPKLKLPSSNQKPLLVDGISTEEVATNQACTAWNGETCMSACGTKMANGVVKRTSTPSRMDTASNSMEPPSEMDKLMKPSLESSPPVVPSSKKVDAELPVSPTESGTDLPTVSPSLFGPIEYEI